MQPKITIVLLTEVFIIRVADINMRSTYQCCCRSRNSDQTIMSPNKSRKENFSFALLTYLQLCVCTHYLKEEEEEEKKINTFHRTKKPKPNLFSFLFFFLFGFQFLFDRK